MPAAHAPATPSAASPASTRRRAAGSPRPAPPRAAPQPQHAPVPPARPSRSCRRSRSGSPSLSGRRRASSRGPSWRCARAAPAASPRRPPPFHSSAPSVRRSPSAACSCPRRSRPAAPRSRPRAAAATPRAAPQSFHTASRRASTPPLAQAVLRGQIHLVAPQYPSSSIYLKVPCEYSSRLSGLPRNTWRTLRLDIAYIAFAVAYSPGIPRGGNRWCLSLNPVCAALQRPCRICPSLEPRRQE